MAHPSKKARKARNLNKISLQAKLQQAHAKNTQLAGLAVAAHNQSAHLARILTFVVANHGEKGVLKIDDSQLASMPDGAKLQEFFEPETNSIVLKAVVIHDAPEDVGVETLSSTPEPLFAADEQNEIEPASLERTKIIQAGRQIGKQEAVQRATEAQLERIRS